MLREIVGKSQLVTLTLSTIVQCSEYLLEKVTGHVRRLHDFLGIWLRSNAVPGLQLGLDGVEGVNARAMAVNIEKDRPLNPAQTISNLKSCHTKCCCEPQKYHRPPKVAHGTSPF